MVDNGKGAENIFRNLDQIKISDIQHEAFVYFGLQGVRNINQALPEPLEISSLQNLDKNTQEIQNFYDRVR